MGDSLVKSVSEIVPLNKISRTKCPFYGFQIAMGVLVDTEGHQCALAENYTPCKMEMEGQAPEWNTCSYNTPENSLKIETNKGRVRVFPNEFGSKGLSLQEWMEYVQSDKVV